ncbi:ComEC/Rec2 family competence protein [Leifsonia flava]|uniref:MBL fold metallo-hydrolase n=1 Tax=Orlajensenia leifsoniae TaxID=2561933 RepID=A0A4Y9R4N0_9MICO|nr:ComEC/Rec2 family competence protein [Leifsonia flava]TFV99260.1 MBL fold metallo-hydrolase [Leifsonia flava]
MGAELRLAWPATIAWAAGFVAIGFPDAAGWVAAAAALSAIGGVAVLVRGSGSIRGRRILAVIALGAAATALVCTSVAVAAPARTPPVLVGAATQHRTVTVEAVVSSAPVVGAGASSGAEQLRFEARGVVMSSRGPEGVSPAVRAAAPLLVFGEMTGEHPRIGSTVRAKGTVKPTDAGEDVAYLLFASAPIAVLAPPPWYLGWADPLRAGLSQAAAALPGDGGDLLPGLAIGDTSAVTAELDAAMKSSSLSHLTAVSGANCAIVVAAVVLLGAVCGLPRRARSVLAVVALAGFVVLVTPQPSVLRAAVMATVVLFALGIGRPGRGIPALSVAVVALLVLDPWMARSYGFALSVAATAGLLLLARPLAGALARWMPLPIAIAVAVPLSAQLACQPILILLDPAVPVAGVLANLLAEPAAPIGTVLGLIGCLLLPVIPGLGSACLQIAWVPSAWIAQIARTVDGLAWTRLPWLGGAAGAVLLALVTASVIWLAVRRRDGPSTRAVSVLVTGLLLTAGAYGGALVGSSVLRSLSIPSDWQYAACDIGQGDAVVVRDGDSHALIDTGPEPAPLSRCLDALGIHRLDLLVLTHYDLDHVGGVDAVLGRVDHAIVGLPETEADRRILSRLQQGGSIIERGAAGLSGSLGALDWEVLWPLPDAATMATGNAGSVTMRFSGAGSSSLFLGDLGEESQDALVRSTTLAPVDVVKVAHHGSSDQSAELYERLRATVGLISVGADNSYGHPTARILEILASVGTVAERTDQQGLVLLAPGVDGAVRVWSERHPAVGGAG